MQEQTKFNHWAIVQLFGHDTVAGRCEVVYFGNNSMVQIDIPEIPGTDSNPMIPAWTRLVNFKAIFDISPVDEQTAREKAASIKCTPIDQFDMNGMFQERIENLVKSGKLLNPPEAETENVDEEEKSMFHDQDDELEF